MTKVGKGKLPVHVSLDVEVVDWLRTHADGASMSRLINDTLKAYAALPHYRHVKRGSVYSVFGRFEVQATTAVIEGDIMIAYRNDVNGTKWVRPETEFNDGRFVRLDLRF